MTSILSIPIFVLHYFSVKVDLSKANELSLRQLSLGLYKNTVNTRNIIHDSFDYDKAVDADVVL